MNKSQKIKLLAKFFNTQRIEGDPDLEKLFSLDDLWGKVYGQNRIILSFTDASIIANEAVLKEILSKK